jgi:hypothetical protein
MVDARTLTTKDTKEHATNHVGANASSARELQLAVTGRTHVRWAGEGTRPYVLKAISICVNRRRSVAQSLTSVLLHQHNKRFATHF